MDLDPRSASLLFAIVFASALGPSLPAQVRADTAIVATELPGNPATLLLAIDLSTSAVSGIGAFAHDQFPPLAVRIDPINRDVLLAVDLGGTSRIVRLGLSGTTVTRERVIGDVPGSISDLIVPYPGDLTATVDGVQGGAVQVERNGGPVTTALLAPFAAGAGSLSVFSAEIWIAESGVGGAPAQLRLWNSLTAVSQGTFALPAIQPPTLTGIAELLTSNPTHVLTTSSGEVWQSLLQQSLQQLPISPALPPGGTEAVRVRGANQGLVLGNAAFPFLQSFAAYSTQPQTWVVVAGPLPGSPVAFDVSAAPSAQVFAFGERCAPAGNPPTISTANGYPQLGNASFALTTYGAPGVAAGIVLGLSDQVIGAVLLPTALPGGGCRWFIAADAGALFVTDASGRAALALPIPPTPALAGEVVFAQCLHLIGGPLLATTTALALHLY